MATIPELRRLECRGEIYAASVLLVPRGEEIRPRGRESSESLPFYYSIAGPQGWSHWAYTASWHRAWANVRRAIERHRKRLERQSAGSPRATTPK